MQLQNFKSTYSTKPHNRSQVKKKKSLSLKEIRRRQTLALKKSPAYQRSIITAQRAMKVAVSGGQYETVLNLFGDVGQIKALSFLNFLISANKKKGFSQFAAETLANCVHVSRRHIPRLAEKLIEYGLLNVHESLNDLKKKGYQDPSKINNPNIFVLSDIFQDNQQSHNNVYNAHHIKKYGRVYTESSACGMWAARGFAKIKIKM